MEKELIKWFYTTIDNYTEYTLIDFKDICWAAIISYMQGRRQYNEGYIVSWDTNNISKVTISVENGDYDSGAEFKINVYRFETDEEQRLRIVKVNKELAAEERRKKVLADKKREREEKEAELKKDPEYLKLLELKKKFNK